MKARSVARGMERSSRVLVLVLGVVVAIATGAARAADEKQPFRAAGTFVEGCSCSPPCGCQLTGAEPGCNGVGALALTSGRYRGADLTGVKIAYATVPGDWVRLYLDVPNPDQREAAEAFARALYSPFGPIEAVKPAKIEISGREGRYTVSVDGGKIMQLSTEPVIGGDKRTPISIRNIHDPLHPTVMQGRTLSGSYQDGERNFALNDSNSYFVDRLRRSGRI